jgi:hypothetical protein
MSGDVERQNKALTLLEYSEAKQKLNVIADIARRMGNEFVSLGNLMGTGLQNVSVDSYRDVLDYNRFAEVVADFRTAQSEVERLAADLSAKGVSI